MWIDNQQLRKWRSDSLEARIYAVAEAEAHANGMTDGEAAGEAMEAVYRVMGWLASGTLATAKEMILEAFGVETSPAALSAFWRRFRSSWLGERMRRSSRAAHELANLLDRDQVESATWDLLSQQAFELLTSPDPDPHALVKLGKLILQGQKHSLDERKVTLLEAKAKQADAAKDVMESQVSEEEKAAKMRAIFGMG
jgi:hypothetical protein